MRSMRLRVVPLPGTGCEDCSRRAVLKGLAMTAASALVGCPGGDEPRPDAAPSSSVTMCGNDLCLDLNDPLNARLANVGGATTARAPRDTLLIVRTSSSTLVALSAICTHQGCGVRYDVSDKLLECPCHGSQFSLGGEVLRGPAASPLRTYTTQFDQGMNLLTIML